MTVAVSGSVGVVTGNTKIIDVRSLICSIAQNNAGCTRRDMNDILRLVITIRSSFCQFYAGPSRSDIT